MTGKQLRNSILQWAIQGKLVSQDQNDEPASVLLERIRAEKARLVKEKKIKRDKNETIIYRGEDNSYYEKTLATGAVRCIDDEIPFDIPESWMWVRFGNLSFNRDSERIPLSVSERSNLNKIYDYYGASGVIDKVDKYLFDKPLLLIGEDGANLINRSTPIAFIATGRYWVNNHAHVIDFISYDLLKYVSNFINAISLVDYITGTAQPKMNQEKMNSILIAIPPIQEQVRINDKITSISSIVEKYEKQRTLLDQLNNTIDENLKKSILQEAIQGKLVPQIESEGSAAELLEEIYAEKKRLVREGKLKASALKGESRIFRGDDNKYYEQIGSKTINIDEQIPFDIPNSWCWIRLGYIIDFSSNSSVKVSNIEPDSWILDLEDIEKDSSRLLQRKRMSETGAKSDKHRFSTGNILYSKLRPYLNKVLIADMNGYCTSEILVFDFGKIYAEYALAYLRSPFFVEYAMSDAYGVKMPRLGSKQGNNALMPIPPLDEQHRIVNKIKQLDNQFI